jgi:uncharacterized protein YqgC (DUF456 family)
MQHLVDILVFIALLGASLIGGVLAVLQLPGTWLILAAAAAHAWYYDFQQITWRPLAVMCAVALAAEALELVAGMRGAVRAGASRAGSWGALLGGFAGMIVFTPLIPVPIAGTVLGGLLGCFAGAYIMECRAHGDTDKGTRVASGAVVGRLVGMMIKLAAAIVLAAIAVGCGVAALRARLGW